MAQRILHTMLRVGDLNRSINFYTNKLGMTLFRVEDYPDGRFTLAFVGFGNEQSSPAIELTYNYGRESYEAGTAYGHIAITVADAKLKCKQLEGMGVKVIRHAGPMSFTSPNRTEPEIIAFIEDPDGYRIELIEVSPTN
jgi:lactoylglutathione lyase